MESELWSDDRIVENIRARESTVRLPHGVGLVAVGNVFNLMHQMRDDYESRHHPPAPAMPDAVRDDIEEVCAFVEFRATHDGNPESSTRWWMYGWMEKVNRVRAYLATPAPPITLNSMSDAVPNVSDAVPAPAPGWLDAPDDVADCEYFFDGVVDFPDGSVKRRLSVNVYQLRGELIAETTEAYYRVESMRGKWYKRDKAPWDAKEGQP